LQWAFLFPFVYNLLGQNNNFKLSDEAKASDVELQINRNSLNNGNDKVAEKNTDAFNQKPIFIADFLKNIDCEIK